MKKKGRTIKIKKKSPGKKTTPASPGFRGTGKKPNGKITPLGDRILLKPVQIEEGSTTVSGIIIPETVSKEKPEQGTVIAVGEGRWEGGKRVPLSVKPGDKVVFSRYGYEEVKIDDEEYYILKEENVLAIIKN